MYLWEKEPIKESLVLGKESSFQKDDSLQADKSNLQAEKGPIQDKKEPLQPKGSVELEKKSVLEKKSPVDLKNNLLKEDGVFLEKKRENSEEKGALPEKDRVDLAIKDSSETKKDSWVENVTLAESLFKQVGNRSNLASSYIKKSKPKRSKSIAELIWEGRHS